MTKVKKEEYGFVEGPVSCANCGMFNAGKCKLVKGDIAENAICMLWTKEGNEVHEPEFTKEEAEYTEPTTRCGICYFFQNGECELVEGHIGEDDCCIAWKEKEGTTESYYSKLFKITRLV